MTAFAMRVAEVVAALRTFFADLQDWAPDFRLTIERAEPIGATRVLVFLRASLTGRASGLPAVAMSSGLGDAPAAGCGRRRVMLNPRKVSPGSGR